MRRARSSPRQTHQVLLHSARDQRSNRIPMGDDPKRTYLVVIDDSPEARVALRFAARRAAKTNGRIEVLGIVEPQDFVQFGGVQAAMEEEQRLRIEGIVSASVGEILDEAGVEANVIVRQGEPAKSVRDYIGTRE